MKNTTFLASTLAVILLSGSAFAENTKPVPATAETLAVKEQPKAEPAKQAEKKPEVKDKEVAEVNGKPIMKSEVEKALSRFVGAPNGEKPDFNQFPADFQKTFLEQYIGSKLLSAEARKAGVANDPEIKQQVQDIEDQLIQSKYITDLVNKEKSEEKLKKLYEEKFSKAGNAEEIRARHILVKTEDEAKKIKEQLDKGEDFAKLAKEKSTDPGATDGGDLGYFVYEQMVPEFSKAAFALKVGEISQPVKSDFGWHIIKVEDKRKKAPPSYQESKAMLEAEIAKSVIDAKVKTLLSGAKIDYKIDLPKPPSAPAKAPEPKRVKLPDAPVKNEPKANQKLGPDENP